MKSQAKLSWVVVDDQLHHVSEYANLPPPRRPRSYCPLCGHAVILHIGKQIVHHAKHKPDDVCPVTRPETTLHLNAKLHLAYQLIQCRYLFIHVPCIGPNGKKCPYDNQVPIIICHDWDDVKVELQINQYRPDIVLLSGQKVVGAVEVFVTHAIEPEKEQHLKKLNIPFIEVNANAVLPSDEISKGWTAGEPIPFRRVSESIQTKLICPGCDLDRRTSTTDELFRVIDFYMNYRDSERIVFIWKNRTVDRKLKRTYIVEKISEEKDQLLCKIDDTKPPKAYRDLKKMFEEHLEEIKIKRKTMVVDVHMLWQKVPNGVIYDHFLEDTHSPSAKFPRRYLWDESSYSWKIDPMYERLNWNLYFVNREAYQLELRKMRIPKSKL